MAITKDMLDELMKEYKGPDDFNGRDKLLFPDRLLVHAHDAPCVSYASS